MRKAAAATAARAGGPPVPGPAPGGAPGGGLWWLRPFTPDSWRKALYVLLAPFVSLAGLVLAVTGQARVAAGIQRRLARRLLGLHLSDTGRRRGWRVALGLLFGLPLQLVAAWFIGRMGWFVFLSVAYPIRPVVLPGASFGLDEVLHPLTASSQLEGAWGGPTLAGAWAVHAVLAVVALLYPLLWIVRGVAVLQARRVEATLSD